jgi:hypothetical protein
MYYDWPADCRHDQFNEERMERTIREQYKIAASIGEEHMLYVSNMEKQAEETDATKRREMYQGRLDEKRKPHAIAMFFDNIVPYKTSPVWKKFVVDGRHYISFVCLLARSYYIDVPVEFRCSFDFVFIFKGATPKDLQRLYESFTMMLSYNDFAKMCGNIKGDSCIVLSARTKETVLYWQPKPMYFERLSVGRPYPLEHKAPLLVEKMPLMVEKKHAPDVSDPLRKEMTDSLNRPVRDANMTNPQADLDRSKESADSKDSNESCRIVNRVTHIRETIVIHPNGQKTITRHTEIQEKRNK